jgi:hypothetical protein
MLLSHSFTCIIITDFDMESAAISQRPGTLAERRRNPGNFNSYGPSVSKPKSNPVRAKLVAEDTGNFIDYLEWQGLTDKRNTLVLPSRFHYYYDSEDLKNIKTVVNLRKLNLIKNLNNFFNNISMILPKKTDFIGCFADSGNTSGENLSLRVYKKFINFLDSRTDMDLNKRGIARLFFANGLEIVDMTEINGLTYFRLRNNK